MKRRDLNPVITGDGPGRPLRRRSIGNPDVKSTPEDARAPDTRARKFTNFFIQFARSESDKCLGRAAARKNSRHKFPNSV